jgi:hypothetical protein
MNTLTRQLERFKHFYDQNKDTHLSHENKTASTSFHWYRWGEYDDIYCYLCAKNRGIHEVEDDIYLCDGCFNDAEMCTGCQEVMYNYELTDGLCSDCLLPKDY